MVVGCIYKDKVWLFIDGGIEEKKLFTKLKEKYITKHDWNERNFIQLKKHDFEDYYPSIFQERVQEIKNIDSSQKKRRQKMKTDLLLKLIKWCSENPELAKNEFSNSFINSSLTGNGLTQKELSLEISIELNPPLADQI